MTVLGTRPEAIKLSPVIHELRRRSRSGSLETKVCVTSQHREMMDQVLRLFNIVPDFDLNIMEEGQSPAFVASAILGRIEKIYKTEHPDWILVQGDTTTVAAASLAAFYCGVKVGHVEAGLRTNNKWFPFPEEINRRVAGVIADLHFAPTEQARQNLLNEGIQDHQILVTGNSVIDAMQWISRHPANSSGLPQIQDRMRDGAKLILVTAHRRENFGEPISNICHALCDIAECFGNQLHIVYPVHLNPNVWDPVHRLLKDIDNITLTSPLDYFSFIQLMKSSYLILTDSGGIQEEATGLGIPVLVLRNITERPEAVLAGNARLVGTDREKIVAETTKLLKNIQHRREMAKQTNLYGDGRASERIVSALLGEEAIPFKPTC